MREIEEEIPHFHSMKLKKRERERERIQGRGIKLIFKTSQTENKHNEIHVNKTNQSFV